MPGRVHIYPPLPRGEDRGDGGIRQVIRGQHAHLPDLGWEIVDDPHEADVIQCHVEIPPPYLKLYGDKPFLLSSHGAYWHTQGDDYEWVEKWYFDVNKRILESLRVADLTTSVSEWTSNALRRASNRDVRVVYHGVNLEEWPEQQPTPGIAPYVLWNKTRVDPICDPLPLINLAGIMPETQFVSTYTHAEARLRNLTVTGTLPFLEAQRLVQRAAVYLCTTRETFGIGTLEALASGVPVVGYAWGGQREFIEHGKDGWLVQPGDIEGLREGVRWALGNDEARKAARAKAEQFPVQDSIAQYARLYEELVQRFVLRRAAPTVSVVVPAYNLEKYLPGTLDSVLAQDFEDWECIVVDDASTDGTGQIADDYAARYPSIRVIHHETNQYLAAARNTGIAAATGRYILPLDADDMLTPNTLSVLSKELDERREIDIAYGGVLFVDDDGRTPTIYREGPSPGHSGWPVPFRLDWMFYRPGQPLPYASMFRREVWENTGGYRTRARTSEDCDFWLRTSSYGYVPEMVTKADTLIYRNRAGSMSREQGWDDVRHRKWYPWIEDTSLLPAAAYRGNVGGEQIPFPALDPVISVVIPVGPGHGKWVHDAVDSVDAQTFRLWECIVVNDSGEDLPPLPAWVRVVEAPFCTTCGGEGFATEDDGERTTHSGTCFTCGGSGRDRFGGAAASRNAGIATARGALYLPLDADDYLQPKALELMLKGHMTSPYRPIVYTDFWDEFAPGESKVYACPDYEPRTLLTHGLGRAVTALTPIRYWREVGGYDEHVAWEDWAFAISCAAKGFCERRVTAPLFTYRKWTGLRREENIADFEASKASIMQKDFGVSQGGELMACSTCGSGRGSSMGFGMGPLAPKNYTPDAEGTVMVEYLGGMMGSFQVKSSVPGWHKYTFSGENRRQLVRVEDAPYFDSHVDYRIVDASEIAADPVFQAATPEPALEALGPPRRDPSTEFGGVRREPEGTGGLPWYYPQAAEQKAAELAAAVQPEPVQPAVATLERPAPVGIGANEHIIETSPPPPVPAGATGFMAERAEAQAIADAGLQAGPPQSPTVASLVRSHTREQLLERAERLGIPNAASMGNMRMIATAIAAVEAQKPDLGLNLPE